jgi:hypothetical protein
LDDDEDDRSWPLYRLAEAYLDGDQVACAAWGELGRAMKGKPVVRASKMLDRLWKDHQASVDTLEPETIDDLPVALVDSALWERARRRGLTEMALELGRTHGVDAMASWWARHLRVTVLVAHEDVPRLFARDGPPGALSPSLN